MPLRVLVLAAMSMAAGMGTYAVLGAQNAKPETTSPDELFERVRQKVLADVQRLPNYTCVETITRTVSRSTNRASRPCDQIAEDRQIGHAPLEQISWERLRLDVAIADRKEVYSWAGASKFGDAGIHDLVGNGQTSSGDFGPILVNVFSGNPKVTFGGERFLNGRRLIEFSYEMPFSRSSYRIRVGGKEYVAGFSGLILIDPSTGQLVRLTDSARLPEKTGYCMTENGLDYQTVRIGSDDVLLPAETRANAIDTDGGELLNVTAFTGCREYVGESAVSFDPPANTPAEEDKMLGFGLRGDSAAAQPRPAFDAQGVPAGIRFSARITTPIDSDHSARGDPVEAVLRRPMYDRLGHTIAKAGAHIHGRLTRFAMTSTGRNRGYDVAVGFLAIDLPGSPNVPLSARRFDQPGDPRRPEGHFHFRGPKLALKQLDADWDTLAPAEDR